MSLDISPNPEILAAQARVCTGPHQSRPLGLKDGDPDPDYILLLILDAARGKTDPAVSSAQMGAFFAAMTLRRTFGAKTGWSPAETAAMQKHGPALAALLPPAVRFLLDPEAEPALSGVDAQTVPYLRRILKGEHLSAAETRALLELVLRQPVDESLSAAVLIGQRMNIETLAEAEGYCDAVLATDDIVEVDADSLTHFGQPFDGAGRYIRPTLWVAAVRAVLGRPTVLHGVDTLAPKNGVSEQQILERLGASTDLDLQNAAALLADPVVGMAYVSQRQYAPGLYRLRQLRAHIAKRPVWATTEKTQRLFSCTGRNCMVVGFYHRGYEEKMLHLMRRYDLDAGLAIKGEEGSSHYALRLGKASDTERRAINYTRGFCRVDGGIQEIEVDVQPKDFGLDYAHSPRPEQISLAACAQAGMEALGGIKGPLYDRIALSVGVVDYYLGFEMDAAVAVGRARQVLDSGAALARLETYIKASRA
jgi:anthranilate phosphoribosyltransferase